MWRWVLIPVLLAITVLAPAMAPTPAQVRVGSSGHALDANLQLGSGGYNSRSGPRQQFMNRPTYTVSASGATVYRHHRALGMNRRYGVGRTGPYTARADAGAFAYARTVYRKPAPQMAGRSGDRLDANLQLGRGGYNAAKSARRQFVSNPTYTVSPSDGKRYNRPSGLGTQQRYSVGRSVPYYTKPASRPKPNVNPYSWSEIWR